MVYALPGKQIMHDPMAMRPFMGYNFGAYLQHWLDMEQPGRHMPKIFHVNWFRVDSQGQSAIYKVKWSILCSKGQSR